MITILGVALMLALMFVSARRIYRAEKIAPRPFDSNPHACEYITPPENWDGTNTLVVFTGRWRFIRILFPYVYRELRMNGGILDRVFFMMLNYDNSTLKNMTDLVTHANQVLNNNVFELHFLGYTPGTLPPRKTRYQTAYYEILADLMKNSSNRYWKIDDDIVYIHRNTFRSLVESKNSKCCFLHFANIVSNWRCNIKHQELGIYSGRELNPKNLKFDFDPYANCGWKSFDCAELTLKAFVHHYHTQQLDKYLFHGLELLVKRMRFSINFHMLDRDLIDFKAMQEVGPIIDDEFWWTSTYSLKFKQPNCIVGGALVVHFSYFPTYEKLMETGLLKEFELIVEKEIGSLMDEKLWNFLDFSTKI